MLDCLVAYAFVRASCCGLLCLVGAVMDCLCSFLLVWFGCGSGWFVGFFAMLARLHLTCLFDGCLAGFGAACGCVCCLFVLRWCGFWLGTSSQVLYGGLVVVYCATLAS